MTQQEVNIMSYFLIREKTKQYNLMLISQFLEEKGRQSNDDENTEVQFLVMYQISNKMLTTLALGVKLTEEK